MRLFTAAFFLLIALARSAAAITADVSVDAPSMALGQTNGYTITLRNSSVTPAWDPPEVPGLVFSRTPSTHSSMQMLSGVTSRETKISWRFQAERTGSFTIPARELRVGGETVRVGAVTVEVGEMPPEMRDRFALRWKLPEGRFYVGQTIPATLQLFVRAGISAGLSGAPTGSSEQFLISDFPANPRQSQQVIGGRQYVAVEWDVWVTPIRAGNGQLPIRLPLAYETGQVQRGFFGNQPVQEQIVLTTEEHEWPVRDLPSAGRPASFTGAVGDFEISGKLARNELEVGQPVTLSLEVRGEGNFPRIGAPDIDPGDTWRAHPPRSEMTENSTEFQGAKKFEYILIPTTETATETPPVAFSWFDPHEESWREIELPPEPVTVRARPDGERTQSGIVSRVSENGSTETLEIATALGPVRSLSSPLEQPVFRAVNGGLACLLAFAGIGIVIKKRSRDPAAQARAKIAKEARRLAAAALAAAKANEGETFYTLGRDALRLRLGAPPNLTADELETKLKESETDEKTVRQIREFFARKDAFDFARWRPTDEELHADRERFESVWNELKEIE